jgi:ABC-type phosphate transport system substrate-binding protein
LLPLLLVVLCLAPLRSLVADEQPVVIVNPDVPVETLGANALRAIFGMRLRAWADGSSVRVLVLKDDSPTHIRFAKQQLSIFPHQLRRAWDRLVYSGTGQAPRTVDSDAAMVAEVAATAGAIGYVSQEMVSDDVRVVVLR